MSTGRTVTVVTAGASGSAPAVAAAALPVSAPAGMDLTLTGLPPYVTARDLKAALSKHIFSELQHDYLVILDSSSEDLFWVAFDDQETAQKTTARLIIPGDPDCITQYIDRNINVSIRDQAYTLTLRVTPLPPW
jgi:hypothetical protein